MHRIYKGQSLTEILVALAIGVAFINVGILAMSTANILAKVNKANNFALSLLKSQRSIIETITENGWHSIADLTIGKHYKLAKQNNSWVIQQGEEKVFDEKPPVAQWNFDEGTGTSAYDNVGTNNGTLTSSPTWQTNANCVNGSCLSFDGSTDYVTVPNSASLNPSDAITVNYWMKKSSATDGMAISKGSWNGFYSYVNTAGNIAIRLFIGAQDIERYSASSFSDGNWHQFSATWSNTDGKIRTYKDGLLDSISSTPLLGNINSTSNALYIGAGIDNGGFYLNASIDEPSIYNYVLTEAQIKQHYNAGLNRLGLVAQWGMDEESGIKAYDSQGTNDGTLVNSPTWQSPPDCVSGSCLSFNGINNYVNCGNPVITGTFTVGAWARVATTSPQTIIGTRSPSDISFDMKFQNGNQIHGDIGNGTSWITTSADASFNYQLNTWYHIVYVVTSTGYTIYVNGNQAGSGSYAQNTPVFSDANHAIAIGAFMVTGGEYFSGLIDDTRVYNRALSADEIANQYKDGYTKYFYVNNVSRDIASDPTASTHNLETTYNANHDDPNTKKITNVTRYLLGTPGRVNTQEQYLARISNINSLIQTDWSGNSGLAGPEIDFGNNYYSSSNLTLSTAGQMSLTSAASSGNLISSIIDTQSINGSGYFNILWQGDALCSGCSVKFQIAASNSMTGPWTYYGPTATSDYYTPSGPGIPVPITYAGQYSALSSSVQNKRYIRYQITLVPASSVSPVVKDVIINYAP
jgi:hypothetical protein